MSGSPCFQKYLQGNAQENLIRSLSRWQGPPADAPKTPQWGIPGRGKPLRLRRGTQQPALLAMLSASSRASGMELACPLMGNPYWKSQALALGSTLARAGPEIQVPKLTASSLRALETLPNHLRPHQMPTLLALWMHRTPTVPQNESLHLENQGPGIHFNVSAAPEPLKHKPFGAVTACAPQQRSTARRLFGSPLRRHLPDGRPQDLRGPARGSAPRREERPHRSSSAWTFRSRNKRQTASGHLETPRNVFSRRSVT